MSVYSNLSVKAKLTAGFASLLVLVVIVTLVAVLKISGIQSGLEELMSNRYLKVKMSNEVIQDASEIGRVVRSALLADDPAETVSYLDKVEQLRVHNSELLSAIEGIGIRPGTLGYDIFYKAQTLRTVLADKYQPLFTAIRSQDLQQAKAYMNSDWIPANNAFMSALEDYVAYNEQAMDAEGEAMEAQAQLAMTVLVVASTLAILLGILVASFISRDLGSRLAVAKTVSSFITSGDLRPQQFSVSGSKDEIGQLLHSLETMRLTLMKTVTDVIANSQAVANSASHLSLAAEQVATSSASQAHATAAAAASVEQLTVSIDSVATNASDAHRQAIGAGELALNSGLEVQTTSKEVLSVASSVDQSTVAIQELSKQMQHIDNVTTVIREVAEQTNLLALNAAIEAARAGEMGRGFAVVADEVRSLAHRTANSVKEISTMVATVQYGASSAESSMNLSKDKATQVVQTSEKSSGSMQYIQSAAAAVRDSVALISDALFEQRAASTDLARNVESIAQLSEENMLSVAAVAETAKGLVTTSDQLHQAISFFKV